MIYGGGLLGLAVLALWVYCIFDVISTQEALVRNLPKMMWLLLVVILPGVGSISWLVLGRPQGAGFRLGDTDYRSESGYGRPGMRPPRAPRALGPEDSPEFIAEIDDRARRLRKWEEDLKRREEELRRRQGEDPSA